MLRLISWRGGKKLKRAKQRNSVSLQGKCVCVCDFSVDVLSVWQSELKEKEKAKNKVDLKSWTSLSLSDKENRLLEVSWTMMSLLCSLSLTFHHFHCPRTVVLLAKAFKLTEKLIERCYKLASYTDAATDKLNILPLRLPGRITFFLLSFTSDTHFPLF